MLRSGILRRFLSLVFRVSEGSGAEAETLLPGAHGGRKSVGDEFAGTAFAERTVYYAGMSITGATLGQIWATFYIDAYTRAYGLDSWYFFVGQSIYMTVNALNDPVVGYLGDRLGSQRRRRGVKPMLLARLDAMRYWGVFWGLVVALCFLFPPRPGWPPWATGFHFALSLVLFDTGLTVVLLNQCAVFVDGFEAKERSFASTMSSLSTVVAVLPLFFASVLYDVDNLDPFRLFTAGCGILATFSFWHFADSFEDSSVGEDHDGEGTRAAGERGGDELPFRVFFSQLVKHKNFWRFVSMNALQTLHITLNSNAAPICVELFLGQGKDPGNWPKRMLGAAVISSGVLSAPILALALGPLLSRKGYFHVLAGSFVGKLFLAIIGFVVVSLLGGFHEKEGSWTVALRGIACAIYLVLNQSMAQSAFSCFNTVLADVIQEDCMTHKRANPQSSSFFGVNALFVKPAVSFAPLLLYWFGFTLQPNEARDHSLKRLATDNGASSLSEEEILAGRLWNFMLLAPCFIGLLQHAIWRGFDAHTGVSHNPKGVP